MVLTSFLAIHADRSASVDYEHFSTVRDDGRLALQLFNYLLLVLFRYSLLLFAS